MPNFFCTWNIPGSCQFDYIYFSAISRKQAQKIAHNWTEFKAEKYENSTEIANGYQGKLLSSTEGKPWKYRSGRQILNQENGAERYIDYIKGLNI